MRFKRDDGTVFPDWSSSEIGNVADICSGGTPSTSVSEYWDGPIQWLTPTEINSKYVHNSKRTITSAGIASSSAKLLPIGALLLTTRATIGACSINNFDGDVSTNQGFQSLICKSSLFNEYAYYAITRDKFQKELIKHSSGSTFLEISSKNLKKLPIPIPCLEEQQKIAFFFSTLDQKIELNERKLEALEKLKKGLMQKIFSREIRFKQEDGSDFPKWNNKRLGEVACLNNGRAYKQEELLNEGKYVVLRVGNFFTNEKYYYSNMELESCKYAHKGDLLYCWSASFGPKIWDGDKVIYHYHIWKIDPINIDRNYLYYYLQRDVVNLEQEMNGGTMMHLTKANMELRSVEIPVIEEQTKIASLFIHFDKKIELVLAKINSLKKLKQGFMQQMFV